MPLAVAEYTIQNSLIPELFTIPVDNHWITAITLIDINQNTPPNDCWARIGLQVNGGSWETRICTLAQGYLGTGADLFWSGKLIADPAQAIFAELIGTATSRYRLLAVVNKIITTEGNRIVVDP